MASRQPKLIILRGLPASGKSTWAHAWVNEDRPHRVRVNKDDLRAMMDNGTFISGSLGTEARIIVARDALVQKFMERGLSVVVDDTNFARHHLKKLIRIAHLACWEWEVKDFPCDLLECITRDMGRGNDTAVGYDVIERMYNKYLKQNGGAFPSIPSEEELFSEVEGEKYAPIPDKRSAVIIDIDGTIALKGTRDPFDETRVKEDLPNQPIIDVIEADIANNNLFPVFMSGRSAGCMDETEEWILEHFSIPGDYRLFMRPVGDNRPDNEVKLEMFNKNVRYNWNVRRVYDDRNQVVAMWRSLGLPVLQVADGAF